jgi:hypothetical protein
MPSQSFQNSQTLGQFFYPLYVLYNNLSTIGVTVTSSSKCTSGAGVWVCVTVVGTLTLEGTLTAALLARQVERRGKRCDLVPIGQETQLSVLGTLKTTIYTSTEQTR